jgi:hypothetical protein
VGGSDGSVDSVTVPPPPRSPRVDDGLDLVNEVFIGDFRRRWYINFVGFCVRRRQVQNRVSGGTHERMVIYDTVQEG